jgi:A/G-specific adenine glycosylase
MVSKMLAEWYRKNSRDLPWREDINPYRVWVSEIILQQTRVIQGIGYYKRFLESFPTIYDLADSPIDKVMKVWQGLGYYSRARNMHFTAKYVVKHYNGIFPDDIDELLKLKGIGDYSAAALISIAYNKPFAAVDGNVYRILSRYYGIDIPVNSSKGKKYFARVANEILDKEYPGQHNQAIMELGALVCLPLTPHCEQCPLSARCLAYNQNTISQFPVKLAKKSISYRYFNYIVIKKDRKRFIKQRPEGDIWTLLYEFPLIETETRIEPEEIIQKNEWKVFFPEGIISLHISKEYKHQLSHRLIFVRFFDVQVNEEYLLDSFIEVDLNSIENYAFPVVIQKYLKQ